jgi:hypothetical protein
MGQTEEFMNWTDPKPGHWRPQDWRDFWVGLIGLIIIVAIASLIPDWREGKQGDQAPEGQRDR